MIAVGWVSISIPSSVIVGLWSDIGSVSRFGKLQAPQQGHFQHVKSQDGITCSKVSEFTL